MVLSPRSTPHGRSAPPHVDAIPDGPVVADPTFETSLDGFTWMATTAARHDFTRGSGGYGYCKAVAYDVAIAAGHAFVRMTLAGPTEIGRVELDVSTVDTSR